MQIPPWNWEDVSWILKFSLGLFALEIILKNFTDAALFGDYKQFLFLFVYLYIFHN